MPAPKVPWGEDLVSAVRAGQVPEAAIDDKVLRILRLASSVGALEGSGPRRQVIRDSRTETQLLRNAAASRFVVLSNPTATLPLDKSELTTVAVIGHAALSPRYLGGGSAVVVPPYGISALEGITNASRDAQPAPTVVMWNGLDSTKEHMYTSGWPAEMAARGISVLQVDCPGSGEALRFGDLKSRVETEDWAKACIDYLETRDDVRHDRIGLVGWSLGGYYVPRAAAFEKRLAFAVAWGANHNWGEVQKARLEREGENPVPHYWEHVLWVWGYDDVDTFIKAVEDIHLNGVVEKITCPFLITHGENDRQINIKYAHQSYDQAVNSPKRELRVFTPDEGATEHIGLDHLPHVGAYTADWIEDTLAELG